MQQGQTDCLQVVQERAHKHALQRVIRADAFAVEHKRVNEWDLSDVMATFANQYRQELRYILQSTCSTYVLLAMCGMSGLCCTIPHHHFLGVGSGVGWLICILDQT